MIDWRYSLVEASSWCRRTSLRSSALLSFTLFSPPALPKAAEGACASQKLDNLQLTIHDNACRRVPRHQDPIHFLEDLGFRCLTLSWSINCRLANLPFSDIRRREVKGLTADHGSLGIDLGALLSHLEDVVELTYSLEVSQDKEPSRF